MQLIPGIYLLSGCLYGIHQNMYGIDFPEENRMILIDCGLDGCDLERMKKTQHDWGLMGRSITDLFLTHCHFDHAGNAAYFSEHGCRVHIGEQDAESVASGNERTLDFAYGRPFPACPSLIPVRDRDRFLLPGGCLLTACHTPGHTPGSMCYSFCGKGKTILFTGDFVQTGEKAGEIRPGISVDPLYNYEDYLRSAARMKEWTADGVLCGHYPPQLGEDANLMGGLYRELLVNRSLYR